MKIQSGEIITVGGDECKITKVSALCKGVMNGNAKVGDKRAIIPMYRIYYKNPDNSQGHKDCVIDTNDIEVVLG